MKTTPCTERKSYAFNKALRCEAKTRRNTACQSPAIKSKRRCRMHGCSKGSGAPLGNSYAITHGLTTTEIKVFRKEIQQVMKASEDLEKRIS
jgi:hypothetical protein